jgi:hypothetical protein
VCGLVAVVRITSINECLLMRLEKMLMTSLKAGGPAQGSVQHTQKKQAR